MIVVLIPVVVGLMAMASMVAYERGWSEGFREGREERYQHSELKRLVDEVSR